METHWSAVAAGQHGIASRRQLLAAGLTARQIDRLVLAGAVAVVHRGLYRLRGAPPTFEQRLLAACLASNGLASHRAAARVWELRGCESGIVEITVSSRRRPDLAGVIAHTTARLGPMDRGERRSIPVTSPGRTLLELGSVLEREAVESALEDALLRGLVSIAWLERVLARTGASGRGGTAVLRSLLEERAPGQAATESVLEDDLVRVLRQGGLPTPVRQFRLGPVRLDVSYPEERLAIEAQSKKWHSGAADLQRDSAKVNLLTQHGWRLLVFTAFDVRRRPGWVVSTVKAARDRYGGGRWPALCSVPSD